MPQRLRLGDVILSRAPASIGLCQADLPSIANSVNAAQRRLLQAPEGGDEGWYGTFAEMVFQVSRDNPYLTLPRSVARVEQMQICERPVFVQNNFYEYLKYGNGRLPKTFRGQSGWWRCYQEAYTRNNVPLFTDMTTPPNFIAVYLTDPADVGKRVLIQGKDSVGNTVTSQDGPMQVQGEYVTLTTGANTPFATTVATYSEITGIQKDVTTGAVQFFQLNPTTAAQILLLTMEPSEETAWYRRYYINGLPSGCCPAATCPTVTCTTALSPAVPAQILVIAKLDLIPARVPSDYLLIQDLEALTEEMQSVRYSEIDTPTAQQMSLAKHKLAIGFLNGQLIHVYGKELPAVQFKPFGSASLERVHVGMI